MDKRNLQNKPQFFYVSKLDAQELQGIEGFDISAVKDPEGDGYFIEKN